MNASPEDPRGPATSVSVAIPATPPPAAFHGRRWPLVWLLVRNLLLMVSTLGIYRFWGVTRVRRFFWRHTRLLGEPLEYLGTGTELFIGFLIAIVVLAPMTAIYSLAGFLMAGEDDSGLAIAFNAAYYAVLLFLVEVAVHRMRRYRLTRTAWRGIRFGVDGSALHYAMISMGYWVLSALTLTFANPWGSVARYRYFARHARFGSANFRFDGCGRDLFPTYLAVAVPNALGLVLLAVLNFDAVIAWYDLVGRAQQGEPVGPEMAAIVEAFQFWPAFLLVLGFLAGVWYRVVAFRYMLGRTAIGDVEVSSAIGFGRILVRYAVNWILVVVVLALLFGAFFGIILAAGGPSPEMAPFIGIIGVLLFVPAITIVRTAYLQVALLRLACHTLEIANVPALERVVQSSAELPSYGEGLADALDVGGF